MSHLFIGIGIMFICMGVITSLVGKPSANDRYYEGMSKGRDDTWELIREITVKNGGSIVITEETANSMLDLAKEPKQ